MAGEASTAGAAFMLDYASGRSQTLAARTRYVALLTAAPTDATTMASMAEVETPASNGYDREIAAWTVPTGDPSSTENTALITFGPSTALWTEVTHCALVSALTGTAGDFMWWWALDVAKTAASGDSITVAAGALTMTAD